MADDSQRIAHPSQLAALKVRRLLSWRAPLRVVIEASGTPLARVHEWERRLSQQLGACGCEHGGVGLLLGLAGYLLYLLLRPGGWGEPGASELWIGLAVLCVTSTLGKVMGLHQAQRELQRTAREIRAQWVAAPPGTTRAVPVAPNAGTGRVQRAVACCGKARSS